MTLRAVRPRDDPSDPPPQHLEAERAVLGAVLVQPELAPEVLERVTAAAFIKDGHQQIYRAIRQLVDRGDSPDLLMVTEFLRQEGTLETVGGHAHLAICEAEATVATQLPSYLASVQEKARLRELLWLMGHVEERIRDGAPFADLTATITAKLADLVAKGARAALPPDPIDAVDLLERAFPDADDLVEGLVPRRGFVIVAAVPKIGKTNFIMNAAVCRTTGMPEWLGRRMTPGPTLMIQAEMPETAIQTRLRLMLQDLETPLARGLTLVTDRSLRLDTPDGQRRIRAHVERTRPDLVIVDPLARLMAGRENDTQDMGRIVGFIDALIQQYVLTVIVVHHVGKPTKDDPREGGDKLRGSSALFAAADSVLLLARHGEGQYRLTCQLRHAPEPAPIILDRTDHLWFRPITDSDPVALQVVAELAGSGIRFTDLQRKVMTRQNCSEATASRLIKEALVRGWIDKTDREYRSHGLTRSHGDDET